MTAIKPALGQIWVCLTRPDVKHRIMDVGEFYVSTDKGSQSLRGFIKHHKPCDLIYVWDEKEWKGG